MAVYTQLSNEIIDTLMQETYGLSPLDFAVGIAEGVSNSNYLVVLKGKTGEEKYILTLYEKRIEATEIPFFLNLMNHLAEQGIACPRPIPRRDGVLFGQVQGRHAALVSFLNGHSLTRFSAEQVGSVGMALARLHDAAKGFSQFRANSLSLGEWQRIFMAIAPGLDAIAPGLETMVRDELAYLDSQWPRALPRGIIHADCFPNNVFFIGDTVSGIIDFYFACEDFYAYELAIAINAWCFAQDQFHREKADALLAAYARIRPLSAAERAALPVLLRGAALRFLLTRAQDWLSHESGALVTPLDPMEYVAKLKFHQRRS